MKLLCHVRTCLILAVVGTLLAIPAGAGKPTPPPPPPTPGPEVYEWRPDLGGWLDTSRNLVWGYSILQLGNYGTSYNYAMNINTYYAPRLEENGDQAAAAGNFEDAEIFYDAADVAYQYNNWRPPTLDEARDAVAKGLFTCGPDGFNGWTGSPTDEGPGLPYGGVPTWTSNTGNKKNTAWVFQPLDGSAGVVGTGSSLDTIVVRTHTP